MLKNVKERVLEEVKEWEEERLRAEVAALIELVNAEKLEEMYFDDIATEEEYTQLAREMNEKAGDACP